VSFGCLPKVKCITCFRQHHAWDDNFLEDSKQSDTHLSLMSGMLMQLAAATAAKGTHLPISGGAVCEHRENIYIGLRGVKENNLHCASCFILHCCGLCIMAEGKSVAFLGRNIELEEEKTKMEGQRKDPRRKSNNYIRIK